ncbi:uncharacterized protein Dwil_GK23288 [Drosophila willistoni]|uniref:Uncharacterized protein n=1 Tax=Drosophila willistoni TaxID=7260 RepID=B4NNC0_DROWI|nr:uncharacterized protein LOC6652177 [Drosophila willistoni]EDW85859.1 uncharacterized protein Dwil_GK23288 [Drosophila willistoni]
MDKSKNNNKENASIDYPTVDSGEDVESNKSTPYFTPMEFMQTSFEFPSPTTDGGIGGGLMGVPKGEVDTEESSARSYTPKQFTIAYPPPPNPHQSTQSPTLSRRFKRFSLYDRRSCSPHITSTSSSSGSGSGSGSSSTEERGKDKENTIPKGIQDENDQDISLFLSKSEHNSPTILFKDESTATSGYSPKLLTSINNLNVSGSPLNIINSAGYKNGNFFRFPEIDHVVQQEEVPSSSEDQATSEVVLVMPQLQLQEGRKNRKNKNNLTIRITDVPIKPSTHQVSPLTKPKTPTIKSTKEKARSLDSAANESELSIVVHNITESHGSCEDMEPSVSSSSHHLPQPPASGLLSTSLHSLQASSSNPPPRRSMRRKSPGLSLNNSSDWLTYHRKQNPYQVATTAQSSLDSSELSSDSPQRSAAELKSASSVDSSSKFGLGANLAPRSAHKHPHQLLHASSTNLKTLPECLTLVEFSSSNLNTNSASPATIVKQESPFKQKSMDLPIPKTSTVSSSSMNLLQRRGSNHSLTLNLHSSCGNLMNSGLSISNYSLGSILNSKSSCNLEATQLPAGPSHQQSHHHLTSQGSRQGLFRRRGSNHSITLKGHTTTSCGDLNSSLMLTADKYHRLGMRTNSTGSGSGSASVSNVPTPKRGLLERRGSNQSLTLNMGSILGGGDLNTTTHHNSSSMATQDVVHPKVSVVCSCAASTQAQRKFFSTENLNTNKVNKQFFGQVCFGSASDLQPSNPPENTTALEPAVCTCVGAVGVRNIMTRPLSPQTTSEEFKIYLASIQMLQSASNPLNQLDLIRLNYVFDHSYQASKQQPLVPLNERLSDTPTSCYPPSSEDSELLTAYQAVVKRMSQAQPILQLEEAEQKRIFRELHKEFWDLPLNHQEKPMVFGSQTKNRYKTILPNEHSRVMLVNESSELKSLQGQEELTNTNLSLAVHEDVPPYINANYIKGPDYVSKCYVATQGPLPNTIYEFWLMIYQNTQRYIRRCVDGGSSSSPHMDKTHMLQQYFQKIIMLTNFTEANRQKCAIYFPIELNEVFAVAAKCEVFKLTASAREYFEQHLRMSASRDTPANVELEEGRGGGGGGLDVLDSRHHIGIESVKVTLEEDLAKTLPANSSFFLVKNVGIVRRNGYSVRKFVLIYCIHVPHSRSYYLQKICCYHYWYPDWPDHHSPKDINTLLDTCLHVLNLGKCESEFDSYDEKCTATPNAHLEAQRMEIYQQDIFNAVQPLPVIHCSAGIGRTGCFTAILNAVRQLRQSLAYSLTSMPAKALVIGDDTHTPPQATQDINHEDSDSSFTCNTIRYIKRIVQEEPVTFDKLCKMPEIFVDVLGIVCNLRLQRGGMVQNSEQYELIHRAICLYLKRTLALRRF